MPHLSAPPSQRLEATMGLDGPGWAWLGLAAAVSSCPKRDIIGRERSLDLSSPAQRKPPELPDTSCWEPATTATPCLGTKLPAAATGTRTACQRGAAEPETLPPLLLDSQAGPCPRQKQAHALLFRDSVLGTYTLLGLLFLPTLSLPVSMATPPNSRFQAAMTSPFPFLPPRPGGAAALGSCLGLPEPQARPRGLRPQLASPPRWPGAGAFSGRRPLSACPCEWRVAVRQLGAEGPGPGAALPPLQDLGHAGRPVGAASGPNGPASWGGRGGRGQPARAAASLAWGILVAPTSELRTGAGARKRCRSARRAVPQQLSAQHGARGIWPLGRAAAHSGQGCCPARLWPRPGLLWAVPAAPRFCSEHRCPAVGHRRRLWPGHTLRGWPHSGLSLNQGGQTLKAGGLPLAGAGWKSGLPAPDPWVLCRWAEKSQRRLPRQASAAWSAPPPPPTTPRQKELSPVAKAPGLAGACTLLVRCWGLFPRSTELGARPACPCPSPRDCASSSPTPTAWA